jgi:hypothetical protein
MGETELRECWEMRMSKKSESEAVRRGSIFGPSLALEGEDSAAYDELVGRLYAAVKPIDVLDEMFIADVAYLEWELLRWRRLKFNLIRSEAHQALVEFLSEHLEYEQCQKRFTEDIARILEAAAPDDQAEDVARKLAHDFARDDAGAVNEVKAILARCGLTMDLVFNQSQKRTAERLVQEFIRGERHAITLGRGLN